jgi:hypothetical protein
VLPLATERACQMFTAEQYRAKAAEFRAFLTNTSRSPNETSEFRDLEQTYTTLAENEEWMAVHLDKTTQRRKNSDNRTAPAEEEDQILKCLGAAVLMRWNTVPTKLQRELFDCASSTVFWPGQSRRDHVKQVAEQGQAREKKKAESSKKDSET